MPAGGGTPALVLLAATLGFLGGRRWPTPASDVEDRESGAFRRGGSADVALPLGRQLEEAGSAGQCKLERSCAYSIDEEAMLLSRAKRTLHSSISNNVIEFHYIIISR